MQTGSKIIEVPEGKVIHKNELHRITVIVAMGKKSQVRLSDGSEIISTRMLKYYHDKLHKKENFFRVHRSYLVNMIHVKEVRDDSTIFMFEDGRITETKTTLPKHIN